MESTPSLLREKIVSDYIASDKSVEFLGKDEDSVELNFDHTKIRLLFPVAGQEDLQWFVSSPDWLMMEFQNKKTPKNFSECMRYCFVLVWF